MPGERPAGGLNAVHKGSASKAWTTNEGRIATERGIKPGFGRVLGLSPPAAGTTRGPARAADLRAVVIRMAWVWKGRDLTVRSAVFGRRRQLR